MGDIADYLYEQIVDEMCDDEAEVTFGSGYGTHPRLQEQTTTGRYSPQKPKQMRGIIASVQPEMKNGRQNSYSGQHGTMYTFLVAIEGGPTGQVSSKSPAPYRFGPGEEVEYTYTAPSQAGWTGKMKVEKPKDGGHGAPATTQRSSSGGWSPAKESSVLIQGILKSVIGTTAPKDQWLDMVNHALIVHDMALTARVARVVERALANQAKLAAPAPTQAPQPATQQHIAGEDDMGLPF